MIKQNIWYIINTKSLNTLDTSFHLYIIKLGMINPIIFEIFNIQSPFKGIHSRYNIYIIILKCVLSHFKSIQSSSQLITYPSMIFKISHTTSLRTNIPAAIQLSWSINYSSLTQNTKFKGDNIPIANITGQVPKINFCWRHLLSDSTTIKYLNE